MQGAFRVNGGAIQQHLVCIANDKGLPNHWNSILLFNESTEMFNKDAALEVEIKLLLRAW